MRAVYYCRVSTDEDNQLNALEYQKQEAKNSILSRDWELIDGYIDEGKSGTSTKKRNEYKRLFEDLSLNKFDVVVIKSQDRLMRNTKEWYIFIDALVTNNKKLFFYLENKFYSPDDALLTGIKAILAEEYSRDLSRKIRNAHRNRQEKGISVLITSLTWGYDKIGKKVVVNKKEAEIVRMIYDLCLQGYGSRAISKILSERGILSRTGGYFPDITVRRIIRNPLFKGTVIMNKRTTDFETKKVTANPENEWKIHENAVTPIVTPEIWREANRIMDSRSQKVKTDNFNTKTVGRNRGRYALSGKITCGYCGSIYWRKYRRAYKSSEIIVDWMCSEYIKRGRIKERDGISSTAGCNNRHIKERDLLRILSDAANNILNVKKQSIVEYTVKIIEEILADNNFEYEREKNKIGKRRIVHQKKVLMDKLLNGTITDDDYKIKNAELEKELVEIANIKKITGQNEIAFDSIAGRLKDIRKALNEIDIREAQTLKLIKRIYKINIVTDKIELYFDSYDKILLDIPKKCEVNYPYVNSDI